ncbi:GAF domain-containing protein [Saccharomonospora sp. NPDC006951]
MTPEPVGRELDRHALDELLTDVRNRLADLTRSRDQLQGLLDAVLTTSASRDMRPALQRIVRFATELANARCGTLEILQSTWRGEPSVFTHHNTSPHTKPNGPGTVLDIPVKVSGKIHGHLHLKDKSGGGRFSRDDEIMVAALAAVAGVAVANAQLFEWSQLRRRWLDAMAEVNATLFAGAPTEDTLRVVATSAQELAAASAVLVLLGERSGTDLLVSAAAGEGVEELIGHRLDETAPFIGDVARTGRARIIADLTALPTDASLLPRDEFGPAVAAAPRASTRTSGVLLAVRTRGGAPFSPEQLPMLSSFATQAAVTQEFATKQRRRRQLVLLAERDRIAQELHDHVIQRLFVTGMGLQGTLRYVTDDDARRRIVTAVDRLDQVVKDIRVSIFDLHGDPERGRTSLRQRLLDAVAELTGDTAVSPTVHVDGAIDTAVGNELGSHAEAVVREGVSNALRHSGATELAVDVRVAGQLRVSITDNGSGIHLSTRRSGLRNVRARASRLGGTATLTEAETGGTTLTWTVPLLP